MLEKLIDMIMQTAIQHAGAERGLLILTRGGEQRIVAEATTNGDTISVRVGEGAVGGVALPDSIINFVMRTAGNSNSRRCFRAASVFHGHLRPAAACPLNSVLALG